MNENDAQSIQSLCDLGQRQLVATDYLQAERTLARAEQIALQLGDMDTLSRLYMPLQESRRQRRLVCGEGIVKLDLLAGGPGDEPRAEPVVARHAHGQLLLAGWGSIEPGLRLRQLAAERMLYVESFLAAVYPIRGGGRAAVIVPTADVRLPDPSPRLIDELLAKVPSHSIVINADELPRGERRGDSSTFAQTMAIWERLHAPFLAAADMQVDRLQKIDGYRRTIEVDYACELAHQKLSDVARQLARSMGNPASEG